MIYIDEMEKQSSQKDDGSPAPDSLYFADGLPEVLFGSRSAARDFAARFEGAAL